MNSFQAPLTRRAALRQMSAVGVATMLDAPALSVPAPADSIDKIIADSVRQPRAMRDGGFPFNASDGPGAILPDNSYDYAVASAQRSSELAARARRLRLHATAEADIETLDTLIWDFDSEVALAPYYWHDFPLAYSANQIGLLNGQIGSAPAPEGRADYLSRLRQAPAFVDTVRHRLRGQVERKLTVPRAEAERALTALAAMRGTLLGSLDKLSSDEAGKAFASDVRTIARGPLPVALDALIETLKQEYLPRLDERSALARAGDARQYHRELLKFRVSDDLDPITTYDAAVDSLAEIDRDLGEMRRNLGSDMDADTFHRALGRDPRWLAKNADDVAARLNRAAAEIQPLLGRYFATLPTTPGVVEPLPSALSQILLNGYFQGPTKAKPKGVYFYNATGLDITTWAWAKSLIAHELLPGHHLQFGRLFDRTDLNPYRKGVYVSGYAEGWGEYARRLMEEAGLYETDPWGLYASRLLDRRFALRTVVELGVHRPDWTWQAADEALASDPLTRPGTSRQLALGAAIFKSAGAQYWQGLRRHQGLRKLAEAQPNGLSLQQFNDTVMKGDSVPFAVLERRVRNAMALRASTRS